MYVSPEEFPQFAQRIAQRVDPEKECLLLLVAEHHQRELTCMVQGLNAMQVRFIGGLFPLVIGNGRPRSEGMVVKVLPAPWRPIIVPLLSKGNFELPSLSPCREGNCHTALVLVDGLTPNLTAFLGYLQNSLGPNLAYLGAGAGSASYKQLPCLISNAGVFADAAMVLLTGCESEQRVSEGWKSVYGPLVVTKAEGNVIRELNWRPALEVYRKAVQNCSGSPLETQYFTEVASGFPLGMQRANQRHVIRTPVGFSADGGVICCGEIPGNAVLELLELEPGGLRHGVQRMARKSTFTPNHRNAEGLIFSGVG
ncbi:MAG: FIST N-terminal domain-containing protein, partial [Bacteroidota bacterium]